VACMLLAWRERERESERELSLLQSVTWRDVIALPGPLTMLSFNARAPSGPFYL
jgi:hypothetical protein